MAGMALMLISGKIIHAHQTFFKAQAKNKIETLSFLGRTQCNGCPKSTGDASAAVCEPDDDVTFVTITSGSSPGKPWWAELCCDFKSQLQHRYLHYHIKKIAKCGFKCVHF